MARKRLHQTWKLGIFGVILLVSTVSGFDTWEGELIVVVIISYMESFIKHAYKYKDLNHWILFLCYTLHDYKWSWTARMHISFTFIRF